MKNKLDSDLDKLARKIIVESPLEKPSLDFTSKVMSQINIQVTSNITIYKPLISKIGWLLIVFICVIIGVYFVFKNPMEGASIFDVMDFSIIVNNKLTYALSEMTFSNTLMYALVLFAIMFFIQIPILKKRFDRELVV